MPDGDLLPGYFRWRGFKRICDVIAFRNAAWRNRRSIRSTSLRRFLGSRSSLGLDVSLFVGVQKNAIELFLLELLPRVGVPVDFRGVSLSPAPRSDVLAFPMSAGDSVTVLVVVFRQVLQKILLGANSEAVDHGVHAGDPTRDDHRLFSLVGGIHPAGELDDAVVESADVYRALTEDRVVAKCFENALLELFRRLERALVVVVVRALVLVGIVRSCRVTSERPSFSRIRSVSPATPP